MLSAELQCKSAGLRNRARTRILQQHRIQSYRANKSSATCACTFECKYGPANRAAVTASTRDLFFCAISVNLFEFPSSAFTGACAMLSQGYAPAMRRQTRCVAVHLLVGCVCTARVRAFVFVCVKNSVVPLQSTKLQLSSTPNPCAACVTTHTKQSHITRHTSHITHHTNASCVNKRIIDASVYKQRKV